MKALIVLACCAFIALRTPVASACGHCHGDDIASVYDGDVVAAAHKIGKCIAYLGVEGAYGKTLDERLAVITAVVSVKGVMKKSAFAAETNPAVRAVYDPKVTNSATIAVAGTTALKKSADLRLTVLKEECPKAQ